jgi:hypothetical protein
LERPSRIKQLRMKAKAAADAKKYGEHNDIEIGKVGSSCAVLGALQGCIDLGLKKNVVFACAFADNAIGADAYKPNDILTAMNGLTVEIGNTDAEGRLVFI